MPRDALSLLRVTITVQVLVALWFIFSPDLIPEVLSKAEMEIDRPIYATLDSVVVPLVHVQTVLCAALWWPTRLATWSYVLVAVTIAALGVFSGPSILSAIDGFFGYLQVLASGAMLCTLYVHRFLRLRRSVQSQSVSAGAAR